MSVLYYWYFCDDCETEWERIAHGLLNGCECSYCGSTKTRFIGWVDDE